MAANWLKWRQNRLRPKILGFSYPVVSVHCYMLIGYNVAAAQFRKKIFIAKYLSYSLSNLMGQSGGSGCGAVRPSGIKGGLSERSGATLRRLRFGSNRWSCQGQRFAERS